MKTNYWSCSKFADWLRGTPKPNNGTAEEWNIWEKRAKLKKVRYWLAEEGLDYLQNFVYWPANQINNIRYYFNNRWITKSHALTSKLKRGSWHDLDTRLLHSVFDELVNFVEVELAWANVVFSEEDRKKYKAPLSRTFFRLNTWRCPEAGIAYLKWSSDLKTDENCMDENNPDNGQFTTQALAAQEIHMLYNWWQNIRPSRPDPSDASGWSSYCEEKRSAAKTETDNRSLVDTLITKDNERSRKILNSFHQLEKEQWEEDTAMLIRLIKIRQSLWT